MKTRQKLPLEFYEIDNRTGECIKKQLLKILGEIVFAFVQMVWLLHGCDRKMKHAAPNSVMLGPEIHM